MNIAEAKAILIQQLDGVEPLTDTIIQHMVDARAPFLTQEQLDGFKAGIEKYNGQRLIHYMRKRNSTAGDSVVLDLLYCGEDELDEVLEKMEDYTIEMSGENSTMVMFTAPNTKE